MIRFELSDKFFRVRTNYATNNNYACLIHINALVLLYRIFSKCSVIKVTLGKSMCLILTTKAFLQPLLLGTNIYVKRCSV